MPPPGSEATGSGLRWSVFTVGDNVSGPHYRGDRYREILDYVEAADRLGFWAFFFAEHHFDPHGEIPDPWLLVAAAAERTRHGSIRLGPMVSNLSFRHPVRVAEQALLANRLANDRVEIGIGSGNVLQEHLAFGLTPDPMQRKREAFDAAVPTFLGALKSGAAPVPGHPAGAVKIPIPPIPELEPRVWAAVGRIEAAVRFASEGYSVALGPPFATMPDLSGLRSLVQGLRDELGGARVPRVAAAFPTYVGPDPSVALEALDRFLGQKHHDGTAHLAKEARPERSRTTAADLVRKNLAVIGTPAEAARQISAIEATGITDYFAIPDFGVLEPDRVKSSLRELAKLGNLRGK
jgi:alkanesulfonate monooxygenase SsuD/methylene tetrahydromethanopterin reductase-like flavin-dependent oxidoreductase (luciferase family)